MKRLILCGITFFLSLTVKAQKVTWSSPISVATNNYGNLFPRIVLDRSGDPLILFGSTTGRVQLSRWSGSSFQTPVTLNMTSMPAFTANWAGPEIGNHGDTIYVVFKQTPETDSTKHIWLLRSTDGGQNFSMPSRVDFIGDSLSRFGAVTTDDNGQPIVSFMKFNAAFGEARYVVTRSNDYGNTFDVDTKASGYTGGEVWISGVVLEAHQHIHCGNSIITLCIIKS